MEASMIIGGGDSEGGVLELTTNIAAGAVWLIKNMWSTFVTWMARQNVLDSPNITMGKLEHGPTNPSGRDADEYTMPHEFVSSNSQNEGDSTTINMDNEDLDSSVITTGEITTYVEDEEYAADQQFTQYESTNNQNQHEIASTNLELFNQESSIIRIDGEIAISVGDEEYTTTEYESTNNENQQEIASNLENFDQESNIIGIDGQIENSVGDEEDTTTELPDYWNPKTTRYCFGAYSTIIITFLKVLRSRIRPPFLIMVTVASILATLAIAYLSYIYNRIRSSSYQRFSPGHYQALHCLVHIFCIIAICSLIPGLLNPP